jgi:23S rRNA (uracil1939-C5)-methyltransferase
MSLVNPITIKTELPAYGGVSLAKWKGKVLLIKGAIPEEIVEIKIDGEKRDYYTASVVKVLEPSPDRIEPECKYFGLCGGCHLQYISYKTQIKLKEEILKDTIRRIGKTEIELSKPLIYDNPWNYRHRGQFKVFHGEIGFYKEKTRDVIDIDNCPLMHDEINERLIKVKDALKNNRSFDNITEVHISYGDTAIALIKIKDKNRSFDKLFQLFLNSKISGLFVDTVDKVFKYGRHYITLDIGGLKYTVSPMSFFQSHWNLNQKVVKFIKDSMQPLNGKKILDLYSGAGNFSLPIAIDADEVIAVEDNPFAIEDGKRNARVNGIKNCRFICSPIETFNIKNTVDISIVDPPRSGLTNKVIDKILALKNEKIVYISCNPSTLARDLKKLLVKYTIESIKMIDFFPHTYHIEALCFMRLK